MSQRMGERNWPTVLEGDISVTRAKCLRTHPAGVCPLLGGP